MQIIVDDYQDALRTLNRHIDSIPCAETLHIIFMHKQLRLEYMDEIVIISIKEGEMPNIAINTSAYYFAYQYRNNTHSEIIANNYGHIESSYNFNGVVYESRSGLYTTHDGRLLKGQSRNTPITETPRDIALLLDEIYDAHDNCRALMHVAKDCNNYSSTTSFVPCANGWIMLQDWEYSNG